jgi:hypothetical protein
LLNTAELTTLPLCNAILLKPASNAAHQRLTDGEVNLVVGLPQVLHHDCRAGELLEGAVLLAQVGQAYGVVDGVVGTIIIAVGATCRKHTTQADIHAASASACLLDEHAGLALLGSLGLQGPLRGDASRHMQQQQRLAQFGQAYGVVDGVREYQYVDTYNT